MSVDLAKPQPPPRKPVLVTRCIRCTGLVLAVVALGGILVTFSLVMGSLQHPFRFSTMVWATGLFLFFVLFIMGYRMLRQISRITVANFAFIYAVMVTGVFIYYLSENMIQSIGEAMGMQGERWNWLYHPDLPLFRISLVLIVFLAAYYLVRLLLIRVLGLNAPPPKPGQ